VGIYNGLCCYGCSDFGSSPLILNEKIGKESIISLFIAIAGVLLIVKPGSLSGIELTGTYMLGIVAGLLSGVIFAALIMNVKILKTEYTEPAIIFWPMGIALLLLSPYAFKASPEVLYSNLKVLIAFGIVSIGFGEIFTVLGLANLKAQTGSLLALIEPVSGVFFDIAILGIGLSSETLAGCFLILASAAFVSLRGSENIKERNRKPLLKGFIRKLSKKIHCEK
jgi:drug/metabolite transporter (DMT)-like permease